MTNIINVTGEPIWFQGLGNDICVIKPQVGIISVKLVEETSTAHDTSAVYTKITPQAVGHSLAYLAKLEESNEGYVIVGTEDQARAYPGRIVVPLLWKKGVTVFIPDADMTKPSSPITIDTMRADRFRSF